jgi:hypothetical protein
MLVTCVVSFLEREQVMEFLLLAVIASVAVLLTVGTSGFGQVCGLLTVIPMPQLLQF